MCVCEPFQHREWCQQFVCCDLVQCRGIRLPVTDLIQQSWVTGREVVSGRSAIYLIHFELLSLELLLKLSSIGWLGIQVQFT